MYMLLQVRLDVAPAKYKPANTREPATETETSAKTSLSGSTPPEKRKSFHQAPQVQHSTRTAHGDYQFNVVPVLCLMPLK
jgi:hypothetical protein